MFGYRKAHEDDVRRALLAGLEITREMSRLTDQAKRRFGIDINVRVGWIGAGVSGHRSGRRLLAGCRPRRAVESQACST